MLFHSSIRKELARSFGATLVVLVTIVMTILLIRTLGLASRGSVNPSEVMLVLALTLLGYLSTLLTLSLFIAMVATLSRMYADSEMVIWFSSGKGLTGFLPPLLRFAWPILLAIAVLSLFAWPWANQQVFELRLRYEKRGDIERVAPGQFMESADGTRVFFIDKSSADEKTGSNVFVSSFIDGKSSVTLAQSGRIEFVNGDRFLRLEKGQRMEVDLKKKEEIRVIEFEGYGLRITQDVMGRNDRPPARNNWSLDLLRNRSSENDGELSWRIGLVLAAANLVLIALAVSNVNPRVGRSGNLIFALLAFVFYYNLVNMMQAWIAAGRIGPIGGLLGLHGVTFALVLLWLARRHEGWSWRGLLRPRAPAVADKAS